MRVNFRNGSPGLLFVAVTDFEPTATIVDSPYWLGAEVDGTPRPIKDLPRKTVHARGTDWEVVYGWNARLMINSRDLDRFREKRTLR